LNAVLSNNIMHVSTEPLPTRLLGNGSVDTYMILFDSTAFMQDRKQFIAAAI
jgi:hypothetical protein